ncbi:hypothetical protein F3F96_06330 [Mariprofundus sp. NF]|uniref:hypothetical protein n=1 Tax=Mariprofundus sp. NF TaxID=2608716 RepID=UPI0015A0B939|nr:hypothetical protein [Mariprofundus sp. NF]NWF38748.1 hypothetical protein [Mariprofundus sp. NF]
MKNSRLSIYSASLLLASGMFLAPVPSVADNLNVEATNQELVDEVASRTGLTTDIIGGLLEEKLALFDTVKDTLTAIKIVDLLFHAQDSEALAEVYDWQVGKLVDKFMEKTYPASFVFFVSSVKLYQVSLEAIRDIIFIPSMESAIYERFKHHRGGRYDYSTASPDEAFTLATASGKYYPIKTKMYYELVKAKGYNPEHIGKKLEASLWKEIDDFWIKRFESSYQKDLLARDSEQIIKGAWEKVASDLKMIAAAAGKSKDVKSFFVRVPDQLPKGWWHLPEKNSRHIPIQTQPDGKIWTQSIRVSRDQGFVLQKNVWRDPKDSKRRISRSNLYVRISPRDEMNIRRIMADSVRSQGYSYLTEGKRAIIKKEENDRAHKVRIRFYRHGFDVIISLEGLKDKNSSPSEALAKYFARAVAANMDEVN